MKLLKTEEAVGRALCHDLTQIIPGVVKDARFRKGHVVTGEDIPVLLSMGKDHLYVWEKDENRVHEDEAARILADLCGGGSPDIEYSSVKEGKIELFSKRDALLKIRINLLNAVNGLGEMMIASRHQNTPVRSGEKICATRIIPLVIEKEKMEQAVRICENTPIFSLLPYREKKIGIVTTGNEIYYNRIQDAFGPVLRRKVQEYGGRVIGQTVTDDKTEHIRDAIEEFLRSGADMILCTGGMSVDADDNTPSAIRSTGADIVAYGVPVLPGAMLLLACAENHIPIVGLPGCVMYSKRTVFDLILPRLMADDKITGEELCLLGKGGLCLDCEECRFPNCGFGKGW